MHSRLPSVLQLLLLETTRDVPSNPNMCRVFDVTATAEAARRGGLEASLRLLAAGQSSPLFGGMPPEDLQE